jgi:hypothetical protein
VDFAVSLPRTSEGVCNLQALKRPQSLVIRTGEEHPQDTNPSLLRHSSPLTCLNLVIVRLLDSVLFSRVLHAVGDQGFNPDTAEGGKGPFREIVGVSITSKIRPLLFAPALKLTSIDCWKYKFDDSI